MSNELKSTINVVFYGSPYLLTPQGFEVQNFFKGGDSYEDYQKLIENIQYSLIGESNIKSYENLYKSCIEGLKNLNENRPKSMFEFDDNLLRMAINNFVIKGRAPKNYRYKEK